MEILYKPFNRFVLRTPYYPISLLEKFKESTDIISEFVKEDDFIEAIYLASPSLFEEILKFREGTLSKKDSTRLIAFGSAFEHYHLTA